MPRKKSPAETHSGAASESPPAPASAPLAAAHSHGPPLQVTAEGVEPHPHRTGHSRTDRIIAAAAIFMSLLSLAVAYKHGLIMRDLVSANSWPLLQLSSSNYDDARRTLSISVQVENVGVGPAIVREFHVRYAGKRYTNPYELLRACCGYRLGVADSTQISPGAPLVASVEGTVVKAGETRPYISMDLTPENKQAWQRLDSERFKLAVEACYCSVLGDCWRSDLTGLQQNKVKACRAAERPAD